MEFVCKSNLVKFLCIITFRNRRKSSSLSLLNQIFHPHLCKCVAEYAHTKQWNDWNVCNEKEWKKEWNFVSIMLEMNKSWKIEWQGATASKEFLYRLCACARIWKQLWRRIFPEVERQIRWKCVSTTIFRCILSSLFVARTLPSSQYENYITLIKSFLSTKATKRKCVYSGEIKNYINRKVKGKTHADNLASFGRYVLGALSIPIPKQE